MTTDSPRAATTADQISPDDLLSGFAKSHLVRWFLAALLLHAIVIGGFSVGTVRDWVDPEGAKARKEAAIAAAKAAAAPSAEGQPAASAEPKAAEPQAGAEQTAAEAKTPIEKATTELAKPGEIPSAPDDLGLSIEDTNPN